MEFWWSRELGLHTSTVGDTKSIPAWPTKIPQTTLCSQKEKRRREVGGRLGTDSRGNGTMEERLAGCSHKPRNAISHQELGEAKNGSLPQSS